MMTDRDIQNLIELAQFHMKAKITPEEALEHFVSAGILDENGEYTPPFQRLLDEATGKE
jgi:hypothetical protein